MAKKNKPAKVAGSGIDREIAVMDSCYDQLTELTLEARTRVLGYLCQRLPGPISLKRGDTVHSAIPERIHLDATKTPAVAIVEAARAAANIDWNETAEMRAAARSMGIKVGPVPKHLQGREPAPPRPPPSRTLKKGI